MKTIFITSFSGLIARNILSTSVLDILGEKSGVRTVILAPEEKKENYQKNFSGSRKSVVVEGVVFKNSIVKSVQNIQLETAATSRLERLFFSLFLRASDTNSHRVMRIAERRSKGHCLQTFIYWILAKLGNVKLFRRALRSLDYALMPKNRYDEFFEQYRPELVFATDIFNEHDIQLMREARRRKIPIVGMVRSWDNITSHGLNRIIPDKLIVNTPEIKEEAVRYNDVRPENIFVAGIPHYDRYVAQPRISRRELFAELNLNPDKKTVFFAPPSDLYAKNNPVAAQIIRELSKIDSLQLIVRLYLVGGVDLGDIKPIPNKIAIDAPRQSRHFLGADLIPKEDAHLADLLYHSDVVAAFASTLAIDALAFNKPIVFIGFDGDTRPRWKSLRQYYDFDHQRRLLNTGGVKLAGNMDEFLAHIKNYVNNPALDEENRANAAAAFCGKLDGKSGARVANILLNELCAG